MIYLIVIIISYAFGVAVGRFSKTYWPNWSADNEDDIEPGW